jgi:DNA-binding GntR family transcriptional regulator
VEFSAVPLPHDPQSSSRRNGPRRQAVVQALLADVVQGRLRAGTHLVTQELADRFGVSHTPIREALIALAAVGAIDLLPNRGAVVRHVTPDEVREVGQVRRALECEAVRSACGRIDRAELETLAAELNDLLPAGTVPGPGSIEQARALDSRLHDLIVRSCGNAFLAKELDRLKLLFRAFRDAAWSFVGARHDYHRLGEETREHQAIVNALLARDARAASRAMAKHIQSGVRYWRRAVPATAAGIPTSHSTNGSCQ